jgi:hypothetical protein
LLTSSNCLSTTSSSSSSVTYFRISLAFSSLAFFSASSFASFLHLHFVEIMLL